MRPARSLLFVLLVLTMAGAGCGDDGGDAGGSGSGSASGVDDAASGSDDAGGDDGGGEPSAGADAAEASEEFCEEAARIAGDEELNSLDLDDAEDAARSQQVLRDWADLAPDATAEDIRFLAEHLVELNEAINEAIVAEDQEAAAAELEAEFADFEAAGERVEVLVADACGVDLSGDG